MKLKTLLQHIYNLILTVIMNSNESLLESAVLAYLNTFQNLSKECKSLEDLVDGVILSEMMYLMTGNKIQGIFIQPTNFSLKLSNLKSIINALEQYHNNVLKKFLNRQNLDLIQIIKNKNRNHTLNLFLRFLGAAIQSSQKQYFIEKILTLPQEWQVCFVGILRDVIGDKKQQSPKRQQSIEKRLLQKLQQLENENEKLQLIIKQIVQQKQELKNRIVNLQCELTNYELQNQKLIQTLRQYTSIENFKPRQSQKQKYQNLVQNLKKKLIEVTKQHQLQKARLRQDIQIQNYTLKLQSIQEQNIYYKQKFDQCKSILQKHQSLKLQLKQQNKLIQEKDDTIKKLKQKVSQNTNKIYQYQQKQIYSRMELEKKNTRIQQLYKQIQILKNKDNKQITPLKSLTKSLSQICPEIQLEQIDLLKQQNQTLIRDLDRSTKKIRVTERQLQKYKRQYDRLTNIESQNKKLEQILLQYTQSRGQQNEILVGCLYELRIKYKQLEQQSRKQRQVMKSQNLNKILPKKLIS